MSDKVLKMLEGIEPGDLVVVDWLDSSHGRIETQRKLRETRPNVAVIDCPVKSYGVFLGLFGKRSQHIVVSSSLWVYTAVEDYGQVDSIVIPIGCVECIKLLQSQVLDANNVMLCRSAFLQGRCYNFGRRVVIRNKSNKAFEVKDDAAESS
jgi:hypothetical protein